MKLFLLIQIAFFSYAAFADKTETSIGRAYDNNNQLIYMERHKVVKNEKGELMELYTQYFDTQNNPFGYIRSDFRKNAFLPTYEFSDQRFGTKAGQEVKDGKSYAFRKYKENKSVERESFPVKENMITGQGLLNYIQANFDQLAQSEEPIRVHFLMPQNLDVYNFRIRKQSQDTKTVKFRVEFKSWIMRLVAPHIDVTLDKASKKLLIYEGPSNLVNNKRKTQYVTIRYDEPKTEVSQRETPNKGCSTASDC